MSQLSFLEAVVGWDEEQCRQHASEALPKLASFLQKSEDVQEQIGITKVICMSLLPWLQLEEAQSQVFAPLTSKSSAMLESILQSIQILVKESQAEILTTLEMLVELVDCFVCCVKFVQDRATATIELCHTSDLVMSALAVLKGTYSHCKDSGELYGDLLSGVTEVLSELFKKAHSLQVAVLSLLEKVTVGDHVTNQEEEHLLAICQGLFDLCSVVTSLDTKLVLGLWKTLSRFSVRHKDHMRRHGNGALDLDAMVGHLCGEVGGAFKQACQLAPKETDMEELALSQGDVAAFQRALKVAGYQMKILTYMLDNFADSTDSSQREVLKLILLIHRSLPPSLVAPPIQQAHVKELHRHVSNAVEPLISLMVGHDTFIQAVLSPSNDIVGEDDWFPFLQLLTRVIDCLPDKTVEVQDRCLGSLDNSRSEREGNTLLDCVFTALVQCYAELCAPVMLPGIVCGGRSEHEVPLYEYVCTHLCGLVGCLPARHFATLEECLLQHVFSVNSFVSSMASDVWCYMARFGTAELCNGHTELILQTYLGLEGNAPGSGRPLVTLMRRLVKFLAPQHQTALLKKFPPSSHVELWKLLPISVFPEACQRDVLATVWGQSDSQLRQFLNKNSNTYGDVKNLVSSIKGLNIFLESQDHPPQPPSSEFLDTNSQLWSAVGDEGQTDRYLRSLLAEMTALASQLVPQLQEQDILKILQCLPTQPQDSHMKLSIVTFLLKISKLSFSPSPELQPTMSKVPSQFNALMTDRDPVVRHRALESFTQFAEVTPYESLVPQCLNDSEALQEMVVAFLNKTAHTHPGFNEMEYLRQQQTAVLEASRKVSVEELPDCNHGDGTYGNHGDMLDEISSVEEPVSKRKRTDDTDKDLDMQQVVADLQRNVIKLERITRTVEEVSEVDKDNLKCINSRLKQLIDSL